MKISMDPLDNPAFGKIVQEYNNIMSQLNRLNNAVHQFRVPKLYWRSSRKTLVKLGKEIETLVKRWLEFDKEASNFVINPSYKFPTTENDADRVNFFHYQLTLIDRLARLRADITLIESNYNFVFSELTGQRNFNIAIISFALGLIGLILTIMIGI